MMSQCLCKLGSAMLPLTIAAVLCVTLMVGGCGQSGHRDDTSSNAHTPTKTSPTQWGANHVAKPVPKYMTGDECLFCHREVVGPTWRFNRHATTIKPFIRSAESLKWLAKVGVDAQTPVGIIDESGNAVKFIDQIQLTLGTEHRTKYLKRSDQYGKLDILVQATGTDRIHRPDWAGQIFGKSCAGCHTTAIDPKTQAFSSLTIDCYSCHGDATPDHSKDTTKMLLAKKRNDPARVVTSICASCHIRTGRSRSTGLPYPNNFVPGDNLFLDFQLDFSESAINKLNPADRHVLENVRDVAIKGLTDTTCLSCHDVHKGSSAEHRRLADTRYCYICHEPGKSKSHVKNYRVRSKVCGY